MQARMKNPVFVIPSALEAMQALNAAAEKSTLSASTKQLVELRVQRQIVSLVRVLNKDRHDEHAERCDRIPVEGGAAENEPRQRINNHENEGGGVSCRQPHIGRPVLFRHAARRLTACQSCSRLMPADTAA